MERVRKPEGGWENATLILKTSARAAVWAREPDKAPAETLVEVPAAAAVVRVAEEAAADSFAG